MLATAAAPNAVVHAAAAAAAAASHGTPHGWPPAPCGALLDEGFVRGTVTSEQHAPGTWPSTAFSFIMVWHAPPPHRACSVGHAAGVTLRPADVPSSMVTQRLPEATPRPGSVMLRSPVLRLRRASACLPLNVHVDLNATGVAWQPGPAGEGVVA